MYVEVIASQISHILGQCISNIRSMKTKVYLKLLQTFCMILNFMCIVQLEVLLQWN